MVLLHTRVHVSSAAFVRTLHSLACAADIDCKTFFLSSPPEFQQELLHVCSSCLPDVKNIYPTAPTSQPAHGQLYMSICIASYRSRDRAIAIASYSFVVWPWAPAYMAAPIAIAIYAWATLLARARDRETYMHIYGRRSQYVLIAKEKTRRRARLAPCTLSNSSIASSA